MAEDRPLAAGEHRRHQPPIAGKNRVADGMHPSMDSMQPAFPDSPRDRTLSHAKPVELRAGNDGVLARGKVRDPAICGGLFVFWMYANQKTNDPPVSPRSGRPRRVASVRSLESRAAIPH